MDIFRKRIRSAIADLALQAALDKNASQRIAARESAYQGLSDNFETLKQRAHAVRADVVDNLDNYLPQFIDKVQANGFIVHRAADATAARDIVLQIAREHKAKLISKSKTMMSEEIELNPALEAAGIQVVETDLGEYIVQLRKEHPSHIITPAVHLRREDVGQTFHEVLGIPLTNDIQVLTDTARDRLRQTFLDTDIGISGVNLGVVETGAICIATNEGNGRMVTTLPKVHIALMGIERLVPDLDSLALLLKMLPRSATGQKITVYVQMISRPRQPEEFDGASERHLVLIDNGRSNLSQTILAETLYCIRCGACINACPVFREIGGFSYISRTGAYTPYPGPIGSALSPGLFGQADFGHLAQASTLCGACKEACPVDIDLPTMLLRVRSGGVNLPQLTKKPSRPDGIPSTIAWGLRIFTWASTRPSFFALAQKFIGIIGRLWSPRKSWMVLPAFTGWGVAKDFPRPAVKSFRERWTQKLSKNSQMDKYAGEILKDHAVFDQKPMLKWKESELPLDRFASELTALEGNFILCDPGDLSIEVLAVLQEYDIDEILSWDAGHLPEGLLEDLQAKGIGIAHPGDPKIRIGLSGVNAAIAETGTIVLTSGAGRPLSTSLLPEIHIAILQEADIYENLPQVLRLREIQNAPSVNFISGPSRTADIEMTLTIGVHGPGKLYVICVRSS